MEKIYKNASSDAKKGIYGFKYLSIICFLFVTGNIWGQSTANYSFATNTTGSLALDMNGNAVDMTTGTTPLVGAASDQGVSSSVSNIGFNFYYMGTLYTQYSASANGILQLGSTLVSSSTYAASGGTTASPKFSALGADAITASSADGGGVTSKLIGSGSSRCLVIQWVVYSYYGNTASPATYQIRLYEGSGIIEYVYGAMPVGSTAYSSGYSVGFSNNTTTNNMAFITTSTNAISYTASSVNTYTANTNITNLHSTADGSRRIYRFNPPTVMSGPTNLTFASVTATGMTLNWTAASPTTGIVKYAIFNSTNGGSTYNYVNIAALGTNTYAATGLTPGTMYTWKVVAISEGAEGLSTSASQATTAGATYYWVGATGGLWGTAANWNTAANGTGTTRTTVATTDVLIVDGAGTTAGGSLSISVDVANFSIGQFKVTSNTSLTIASSATTTRTITITGGGGDDFVIENGSSLITNSASNAIGFAFSGTGNTGDISGTYTFGGSTANLMTTTGGTSTVVTVNSSGIVNNSIPSSSGCLTGSAATLIFANGSQYNVSGATTGAPWIPLATWGTNSTITVSGLTTSTTTATNNNQSFGNFVFNCPALTSTLNFFGTITTAVIKGNLIITAAGATGGTGIFRAVSTGMLTVNGDVTITQGRFQAITTGTAASSCYVIANGNTTIGTNGILELSTSGTGGYSQRGTTFTNNGVLTGTSGSLQFLNSSNIAQTYTGSGSILTNIGTFLLQNGGGLTMSGATNQLIALRVNLIYGTIIGSNKITLGTGLALSCTTQIGAIGLTTPGGSFDALPTFNLGTGTYNVIYQEESVSRTTGFEIPSSRMVNNITLFNANGIVISGGNLSSGALTFSAGCGNITTTSSNVLTITATATNAITRTSSTAFVNGPLELTLPASLTGSSIYYFPVGKSLLNPFELTTPITTAGGTVVVRAEVFDGNSGGTAGNIMGSISSSRYWAASIVSGAANYTSSHIRLTDATTGFDAIGGSSTLTGAYDLIGGSAASVLTTSIATTTPVPTSLLGFYTMGAKAAATLSNLTISPTGNQCTNVARSISVTATPGGGAVTGVALNYSVNGVAQTAIAMTNPSGNNWTGTIPTITPANASITWSVTATDANSLTKSSTGTGYQDEPNTGISASASATPSTVCAGGSSSLNISLNGGYVNLSEGFEGASFPPTGWTTLNAGTGNNWATSTSYKTGSKAMQYGYNSSNAADAWIFTPAQQLLAGQTYTVSFWYNTSGSYTEKLKVTAGSAATKVAQTNTIWTNSTLSNTTYAQATATFLAPTSGTYYFAFNCFSASNQYNLYVDDISISGGLSPITSAYSWSDGSSTIGSTNPLSTTLSSSKTYTCTATVNGCPMTASVTPTVNTLPTATSSNSTICSGSNAEFNITGTPNAVVTYNLNGGTNTTTTLNASGSSTITVTNPSTSQTINLVSVTLASTGCSSTLGTSNTATVNTIVSISSQPQSISVLPSANATFSVTASGTGLTYQWQESTDNGVTWNNITDGGIYSGSTTSLLTLTSVSNSNNAYQYQVIVSGTAPCSSLTSNAATLTVSSTAISAHPQNQTICSNSGTASFSVTTTGTTPNYQWQISTDAGTTWNDIPGEVNSSLSLTGLVLSNSSEQYRCQLNGGLVNSNAAILTVYDPPIINTQPTNITVCSNATSGSFSVSASGSNLTYQWQISTDAGATWSNVSGATGNSLSFSSYTNSMDGYQYKVIVSGSSPCTAETSNAVTLNVTGVSASTSSATTCANSSITLTATPTSSASGLSYSWSSTTGSGASTAVTGSPATITPTASGSYTYTLATTGGGCSLSNTVAVTVNPVPTITAATASPSIACSGASITLTGANSTIVNYTSSRTAPTNLSSTTPSTYGLVFDVTTAFTLNSIDVFNGTTSSGTFVIQLQNSAGAVLQTSSTFTAPAGTGVIGTTVAYTANLGWNIPIGTGYRLLVTSGTASLIRESSLGGFPYTIGSVGSITSGYIGGTSTNYYYLYNWKVSVANNQTSLYSWSWNSTPAISTASGTTTEINTGSSAITKTYTVTATNASTGCSSTATTSAVTINPATIAPTATNSAHCGSQTPSCSVSGTGISGNTFKWYTASTGGTALTGQSASTLSSYSVSTATSFYVSEYNGTCESPRAQVDVTVSSPPTVTASATVNPVCSGSATTLSASSFNTGYTYAWSNSLGSGASVSANPTSNTTYTVTATDNSGGANNGCVTTGSILVSTNPIPSTITLSPSVTTGVCNGSVQTISLTSGGTIVNSGNAVIGTGTSTSGTSSFPNPFSAYYGGVKHQILYTASELLAQGLTAGSSISAVTFSLNAAIANTCSNLTIKMGTTLNSSLSGFVSGTSTVYGPINFTPSSSGNVVFTFSAPFTWNGSSNLIVEIVHNAGNSGNGTGTQTNNTTTLFNSVYYGAKDNVSGGISGFDALSSWTSTGSSSSRPNIVFSFSNTIQQPITWSPTADLYTDAATTTAYSGTAATTLYTKPTANRTYTATATIAATGCTNTKSVNIVNKTPSNNIVLASSTSSGAVEQCTDANGWTYYGTAAKPDEWLFGIYKNGNNFTATVDITLDNVNKFKKANSSNGANQEHASYTMSRYWNVNATGTVGTGVKVRFFIDPQDITDLLDERDNDYDVLKNATNPSSLAVKGGFEWFKTINTVYNPSNWNGNKHNGAIVKLTEDAVDTINGQTYVELSGITSFSGGSGGSSFGPSNNGLFNSGGSVGLPVTWKDVKATVKEEGNLIQWITSSEKNTSHFEVEYSYDAKNFFKASNDIKAAVNSTTDKSYDFMHLEEYGELVYYRIKQVDLDGKVDYSKAVVAKRTSKLSEFHVSMYPVPLNVQDLNLKIQTVQKTDITITINDLLGRGVYTERVSPQGYTTYHKLSLGHLQNGTYHVTIDNGLNKSVQVLVVGK